MTVAGKSTEQLRREWAIHPYFKYRGCAPDPDDPLRMAGDPSLHVGAHHGPDAFLPEGQVERRAREARAVEVCLNCPVMVQCDAYASSVRPDGRLAEPEGVWGGRRALERHKALIRARHATPAAPNDRVFHTVQKQAVLRALASCWDPFEVAAAAGMDVRTANWQRSSLVRLLGLPKDVSRMRALAAARERGLLEGVDLVPDDGSVPAIPPPTPTKVPVPADTVEEVSEPVVLPEVIALPVRRPRRSRVRVMPGQLSFDDALAFVPVQSLLSSSPLGAAA
ncbi:WhiB family transcriptional regulator [Streptomyces sp. SID161]|uniref:WhiB family transcriptional regulator n=1 Tax=Streptomyces sp. SID161 TaxID=2690251 RepID=UPI00137027E3|nr:WhiB family transcriptional regulator [Streptomyces sp. SID161]MYW49620.1 hypothetical protein [Streptomyces sp. SID161]